MSQERRVVALVESVNELTAALGAGSNADEVWRRVRNVMDWLYQFEEAERASHADYYDLRSKSEQGRALAGLIWVRGLSVHRQAQPDVVAINRAKQQVRFNMGPSGISVRETTLLQKGFTWANRSQLPDPPPSKYDRDLYYDQFVAGKPLLDPITQAIRFLFEFLEEPE